MRDNTSVKNCSPKNPRQSHKISTAVILLVDFNILLLQLYQRPTPTHVIPTNPRNSHSLDNHEERGHLGDILICKKEYNTQILLHNTDGIGFVSDSCLRETLKCEIGKIKNCILQLQYRFFMLDRSKYRLACGGSL